MSDSTSPTGFVPPDPEKLAHLFPGYDIVRLIACGGMGAVYEAIQRSLDRGVAIKILPQEFTADESFRTAFQAEAKAMARLNHPNLISVYDFGEVEGMLYIIMEYVPGLSLYQATEGQPLDPSDAVRLVSDIARGLAHAHESGIIHRDIKPANILLNHQNIPKIGDFGLARPLESQIEEGEDIFGTPGYTAPEVVENPQSIDHRADVFSLGILLHELLTGQLPEADPRPASAICHCDPRFDAVIRKATRNSPNERYLHAEEIAKELEKISTTAGPRALKTAAPAPRHPGGRRPPPGRYQAPPKPPRSKAPLILILLIAIGGVAYLYQQKSQKIAEGAQAIDESETQEAPATETSPPPVTTPETRLDDPEDTEIVAEPTETIDGVEHWRGASSTWESSNNSFTFTLESGMIGDDYDDGVFKQETWNGDGYFTIRIDSLDGGRPADAKAGLMLREKLDEGSRNIFLARTSGGETVLQFRPRESHDTMEITRVRTSHSHLGIQRTGDKLTAIASSDGESWTDLGTYQINDLASTLHIGFAAGAASKQGAGPLTGTIHTPVLQSMDDNLLVDGAPPPRININELFRRARSVMRERAKPVIAEYERDYQANLDAYAEHSQARIDAIIASGDNRIAGHYKNVLRAVEANGHIAYTPPSSLLSLDGYQEFHQTHLERQHQIDREYTRKMAELADVYLNGIHMQIERSKAEDDTGAVKALELEKKRITTFPYYFRTLMARDW